MKKLSFLFAALLCAAMSFAGTDYSAVYTSNVTLTAGTNGSEAKVNIGTSNYDGIKLGTGSKTGTMTITVPSEKNVLYLHAAAWKDKQCTLSITTDATGVTLTPETWILTANAGISDSSPFTFSGDVTAAYFYKVKIDGNTAGATITLSSTSASAGRCVVWGVNADIEAEVVATAVDINKATASIQQYKRDTLTATLTPAEATTPIVWSSSNEDIATVANGIVTAKAIGTAKIYATAGTVADSCAVTVTAATPITVAKAVEIAKTVSANNEIAAGGMYVIRGYVTELYGTPSSDLSKYGNYSVWLADAADGGKVFEAYQVVPTDGKTVVEVGDYVEVIADITKYNDTYETVGKTGTIQMLSMRGSYTVGTADCDYASLAAAFTAYNKNAAAGMVTGDVTLQIASDLTETKNVGIQNPTDYTLTITVDKAEARTISFSQTADNAGPSGNICIGCDMTLAHTSASVASKNIVIDGAYNGSEESYLTIKSVSGCHKLNGPVLIYGNVTNCTVKNCNLIAENGAGLSLFLVNIRTQNSSAYTPTDITIENNYLYAIAGNADQGIQLTKGSGNATPKNIKIEDNTIIARTRGIFINGAENATIFGNEVQVLQTNSGSISYGIWGYDNTTGVFNVNNNVVTALTTGANASGTGIVGICAGAGNWYIRNNYVSGFQVASTAANGITLTGIQGSAAADVLVIEHNTVALADQTNAIATPDLNKVCMIKPLSAKATVRNNLVYSAEADFNNALISPAGTLAGNVYCTQSYIGSADSIKTLVDYKAFYEATAKTVASVEFANLTKGDLDLTGASDGDVNLGVDAIETVETDINGTVRAAYTYAGAYEGTTLTKPVDPATGIDEVEAAAGVQKIVRDGQVLILRDGKTYNVMGQVVE